MIFEGLCSAPTMKYTRPLTDVRRSWVLAELHARYDFCIAQGVAGAAGQPAGGEQKVKLTGLA